jgi:predicted nucleic acid-binding protein
MQDFLITLPVARSAGELKREHRRKGIALNLGDVIIAAVAPSNSLTLLTDNVKDFPMKELSLYPLPKG